MAHVQHLPLYSSIYRFIRELYRIKLKLPKIIKHDLGQEVFQSSLKLIKCVVLANNAQEKGLHISRLLLESEVQWVLIRLLFDLRGISEGEFKVLSEQLREIEKQAQAWLKWQQNSQAKKPASQKEYKNTWQPSEKEITWP